MTTSYLVYIKCFRPCIPTPSWGVIQVYIIYFLTLLNLQVEEETLYAKTNFPKVMSIGLVIGMLAHAVMFFHLV